ncbi:MBL fold metallo-hydrolase [Rhodococcoides kyotonense]|uniref:Glyoxylase, beta-lactamase superfamily II n=1 Tax=Rhodococcoides kyotonense TaxID=398843 RepID=A0A239F5F8_9NOCA|nr:MBL fold metallo-hydrolase [Rhodococcus kyotonensis]SNS52055.1 Glyoxylase, beta-lactamase superfamily II [Rhodococcus kyotonensis]
MSNSRTDFPSVGVATRVAPRVEWVLAPNAGAWTFQGTNTWIVGDPESRSCAVIDPGPDDAAHAAAVAAAIGSRHVTHIVLTHGHGDHAGGAPALSERTGTPITKASRDVGSAVADGDRLVLAGGVDARIMLTPGHTRDSLCVHLLSEAVVFTGDTVLGNGSPVVHPGLLGEMLDSLSALERLGASALVRACPGHGPVIEDLAAASARRLQARYRRIDQVRELRAESSASLESLVTRMYPDIADPDVRNAARSSVQAMLTFLDETTSPAPGVGQ